MASSYGSFGQGFTQGFSLMDRYYSGREDRARRKERDTLEDNRYERKESLATARHQETIGRADTALAENRSRYEATLARQDTSEAESKRRWDIEQSTSAPLKKLKTKKLGFDVLDKEKEIAADQYHSILSKYGANLPGFDFMNLTAEQQSAFELDVRNFSNNNDLVRRTITKDNPNVNPKKPLAKYDIAMDQKTKQPVIFYPLNMKDGSIKPMSVGRGTDDDVIVHTFEQSHAEMIGLFGRYGAMGERSKVKAETTLASAEQKRKIEMENVKQGNRVELQKVKNTGNGKVTLSQQSNNSEIDQARKVIAGLSREEVIQRTQEATATGRDNPVYDPYLAALVKKAASRKIGTDPEFTKISQMIYGGEAADPNPTINPNRAEKVEVPLGTGVTEVDADALQTSNVANHTDDALDDLMKENTAPMPDARQAPDGQWYVQRNGQWFRVKE